MPRGQQKVIVSREDLPPVSKLSSGSFGYIMRYRIISEDQNRFSHWSPIREIEIPQPIAVQGDLAALGNILQAVWGDEEERPNYDVFVKFDNDEYFYHGTTPTHQYSFLIEGTPNTAQIAVQIESNNRERSEFLTIFESDQLDLVQLS